MNKLWLGLATAVVASTACAAWTLDVGGKTLSNETWKFTVTIKNTTELTITKTEFVSPAPAEPNYVVDFKNEVISDTDGGRSDYKVVALGADNLFRYQKCTKFLAPDCTKLGGLTFYGNTLLTEVELSPNTSDLGNGSFYGCSNFKTLRPTTLPNVTSMDYFYAVFYGCSVLEGDFVFSGLLKLRNDTFNSCKKITSITAPNLTQLGTGCFCNCSSLTRLELSSNLEGIPNTTCYGCSELVTFLPMESETVAYVGTTSSAGTYVFYNCSKLTGDFNYPNCKWIGKSAFSNGTTGSPITSFAANTCTNIDSEAFKGCQALVSFSAKNAEGAQWLGSSAFQNCTSLQTLELSSGLQSLSDNMCAGCSALETFSPTTSDSVTQICSKVGYAFSGCSNLKTTDFEYPNCKHLYKYAFKGSPITSFKAAGCTNIMDQAFEACTALKEVELGPELKRLGASVFNGCTALESFGPFLPKDMDALGASVFYGCSKLTSDLVWDQQTISLVPNSMFRGCTSLASITFENVKGFDTFAFLACSTNSVVSFNCAPPATLTTAQAPFSWADGSTKNNPYVFRITNAAALESWKTACEPNAATFETWKTTRKDYPGKKTIGLITNVGGSGAHPSTHWVLDATAAPGSLIMLM